jgi:hypothetical protein
VTSTNPPAAIPSDLADALDRVVAALAAMGTGDPAPYAALWPDSSDVTLFGAWGPIERGHDAVTTRFTWVVRRFSDGALVPCHDVIGVSGDLVWVPRTLSRRDCKTTV